jgi:flagellar hook-length control protein FliK
MEMLNIPPAQPQTKPTTVPQGKSGKGENQSFHKVLGKANQDAQNPQQKESMDSTKAEGKELDSTVQQGDEAKEHSQQVVSTEEEEQTTAEDTTPVQLPGLPAETVKTEPVLNASNGPKVTEDVKQSAQTDVASATPAVTLVNGTPEAATQTVSAENAVPDEAKLNVHAKDTAQPQEPSAAIVKETLPPVEKNVADSPLPAGLADRTASVDSLQKMATPENAASAIAQVNPVKTSEPTDLVSNESSKKTGLMESSLGSLLQEVRPLRDQSRGRLNASLSRGETASIAISGQESSKIVAGAQNEDSHPSFASKQENGFSALQSDAATNGANSAINATPFETALESGMHGSLTAQQGNQPLQAASVEPGSIRLASGEFMSENQIVNQVMDRIAVERSGNLNRIVVKMNPEELGEVKLALTMEKDQLRAQLLTQNQQVQEILQKHLPKLHEALSQQGLKLEDIQVGVDSNRHSDQGAFANHRQPDSFRRHFNAPAGISNNVPVQPAIGSARSVSNQGLSLRI